MYLRTTISLWLLLLGILTAESGAAFVRTSTEVTEIPIFWKGSCMYYSLHEAGSDDIPFDELRQITRESFDAWEDVDCSYFYFEETVPATIDDADFHLNNGNVNLLVWRESVADWPWGTSVVAMTSINYDENSGRILDADIEFNGVHCTFGNLDTYPSSTNLVDLKSTMTHEIGHTFGLDHPLDMPASTMFGWDAPGSVDKRSLEQDDIDGICDIYPEAEDPGTCEDPFCGLALDATDKPCTNKYPGDDELNCDAASGLRPAQASLLRSLWQLTISFWRDIA